MPVQTLGKRTVSALVEAAAAAPSMQNAQPWRFRQLGDDSLQVRAAMDRVLPHCDPFGRGLHLACGAATFNLRVAAAHAGWAATTRLLPDPYDPRLMATVRLARADAADRAASDAPDQDGAGGAGGTGGPGAAAGTGSPSGASDPADTARAAAAAGAADVPDVAGVSDLAELYPAIPERRSSRHPFSDTPVPDPVREALRAAAEREGAVLHFLDPWHGEVVLDLVHDAEGRDLADRWRVEEMMSWTRTGPETAGATDGVPDYAFGPRTPDGRVPVRDFAGREPVSDERREPREPGERAASPEAAAQLAVLGTAEDRPVDWLTAGQAMERVLLVATEHGVSVGLSAQALEWSELRWPVPEPRAAMGRVQVVLRLGYGPPTPATPRRSVDQVLVRG